jgi:ABC-2 type transport system ATP-binding protein
MLKFRNFQKLYGYQTIIEIESLTLQPGIYWIRGANGTGKSSLLKSMAGIVHCEGDILLNSNISLKKNPIDYRKKINFGDAEPLFPQFLTGFELIQLFIEAKSGSYGQIEDLVQSFGIHNYLNQHIGTLSSGALKKLSLVLSFIGNPEIILLDEPLITLDADAQVNLLNWIKEKHLINRISFLITSHQDFALGSLPTTAQIVIENKKLKVSLVA